MRITPNVKCQRVLVLLCGWSILCDWLVSSVTTILHNLLLSRISLLCIVTDRVAWYVCLSCEPSTEQDAVWDVDSGGPKEPSIIRYGSRSPPCEGTVLIGLTSAQQMAAWKSKIAILQQNLSFGEMPDQVHFSCRKPCWKVTKYDVHIWWLTVSAYECFECPLYIELRCIQLWTRNLDITNRLMPWSLQTTSKCVALPLLIYAFTALTLLVGQQEGHLACKNWVMRSSTCVVICLDRGANVRMIYTWSSWCHCHPCHLLR